MGNFSCNLCAYPKEEQNIEDQQTLTIKADEKKEIKEIKDIKDTIESNDIKINQVMTEIIDIPHPVSTIISENEEKPK
jgi:hypothetical protein